MYARMHFDSQLRDSNEDYLCGISIRRNARSWDHSGSFSGSRYIYAFIRNFCEKFLSEILERNFLLFSYRSSFFVMERLRRRIEVERRGKKLKQVRNLRKWLERVSRENFQGLRIIFFFFFLSLFLLDTTRKKNLEVSIGKKKRKRKEKGGRKTATFRENRELWNGSSGCN